MGDVKVQKSVKLKLPFNAGEAVRDLKQSAAGLEHHIDLCDDLDTARWYEDRLRMLLKKAEAKRIDLQSEKSART